MRYQFMNQHIKACSSILSTLKCVTTSLGVYLAPLGYQAITWIIAGFLSMGATWTYFCVIWIINHNFQQKYNWKCSLQTVGHFAHASIRLSSGSPQYHYKTGADWI